MAGFFGRIAKFWQTRPRFEPVVGSSGAGIQENPVDAYQRGRYTVRGAEAIRRARDMYRDDSYTRKYIQLMLDHCAEMDPQFPDPGSQAQWDLLTRQPAAGSYMGWRDFLRLVLTSWAVDGEVFLWLQRDTMQWLVIDPLMIHHSESGEQGLLSEGIRYNVQGFPVAYLVHAQPVGGTSMAIPAADILHLYIRDGVGQRRGHSWLATAEAPLNAADSYEEALVTNAWAAANMPGYLSFPQDSMPGTPLSDFADLSNDEIKAKQENEIEKALAIKPGQVGHFPEGTTWTSMGRGGGYRSADYDAIRMGMLGRAASGLGVSYYALAGDTRSANYSSLRFASLDDEARYGVIRRQIRETVVRMLRMWGGRNLVATTPPGDIQWLEPPYRSVDPVKDATANRILVELGVKSKAEVIRERGKDPDSVFAEVEEEGSINANPGANQPPPASPPNR